MDYHEGKINEKIENTNVGCAPIGGRGCGVFLNDSYDNDDDHIHGQLCSPTNYHEAYNTGGKEGDVEYGFGGATNWSVPQYYGIYASDDLNFVKNKGASAVYGSQQLILLFDRLS